MPGEGEISLEQLYKMLHISKRKAAWMLNNGIIPCQIRPTKTHRYVILLEDVEIYLQKQRKARREEIPVGIFNAKPRKREVLLNRQPVDTVTIAECYITLADDCKEALFFASLTAFVSVSERPYSRQSLLEYSLTCRISAAL